MYRIGMGTCVLGYDVTTAPPSESAYVQVGGCIGKEITPYSVLIKDLFSTERAPS